MFNCSRNQVTNRPFNHLGIGLCYFEPWPIVSPESQRWVVMRLIKIIEPLIGRTPPEGHMPFSMPVEGELLVKKNGKPRLYDTEYLCNSPLKILIENAQRAR